ncbi:class I SAM-dependent methyltransferase [Chryseobacterium salivictor]|uniref:27-O-demethylrifamycin SV methyltransferase n=1 Tax=Chryseobacterium salivictor TaxID=2547600 RepID=A0A4P6ZHM5_9FLAO|nr:class I SAM-dependent methyltransferase [Chryseobacterium salivictor]QBO59152.1 27-O-demethylrifamycin SV methyltransferase [Chryseobacterium salivictor]
MIKYFYQAIIPEKWRNIVHINLRKIKSFYLKGDAFYCPCCGKSSSMFLSKGNGIDSRKNAVCPRCGSLERSRLLYLYLKRETEIFHGISSILHFAPEAALKKLLKSNPNYIDVDINPNLATYQMDITNLKYPDDKFDYIICSHVLGHIPDENLALSELYRVLKPGGSLFLLSLMDLSSPKTLENKKFDTPEKKLNAYGEKDLERLYGRDFIERIRRKNIHVEEIDYRRNFSKNDRKKMSLGNGQREIIYKISKN